MTDPPRYRCDPPRNFSSSASLLLSSLELSDTKVYEPQIRARLGTATLFAGEASSCRFRANKEKLNMFSGLLLEIQGQNLAVSVLYVPCLLDTGTTLRRELAPHVHSGDTTPCRMTGVTLHSHVHYKEI